MIAYYVPRDVGTAALVVRDGAGRQVLEYVLEERGVAGQVIVRMRALASGVYEYGVVLDGRLVATKQMQLVR
ncbi:MAG: hypothetical protein KatS3mg040_0038 [Candidatus Kapaibacterium sp.]|nr:MAG: hypothetical protein KatS3mg040_0038 [Candidatus Kapabacteria bacterium]